MQTQANDTTTTATEAATVNAAQPVPSIETVSAITTEAADATAKAKAAQRAKREAASPKPATPAKPAKRAASKPAPASHAKPEQAADKRAAKQAFADELRAYASRFYANASLAAHKLHPAPRDLYISRAVNPVQIANSISARDESGLALLLSQSKAGAFDPVKLAFDVGILSRLASQSLVAYIGESDSFALTARGATVARAIVKRATA